jgi:hypothetical protein
MPLTAGHSLVWWCCAVTQTETMASIPCDPIPRSILLKERDAIVKRQTEQHATTLESTHIDPCTHALSCAPSFMVAVLPLLLSVSDFIRDLTDQGMEVPLNLRVQQKGVGLCSPLSSRLVPSNSFPFSLVGTARAAAHTARACEQAAQRRRYQRRQIQIAACMCEMIARLALAFSFVPPTHRPASSPLTLGPGICRAITRTFGEEGPSLFFFFYLPFGV